MRLIRKIGWILILVSPLLATQANIRGIVRDQATQQPLMGVNIIIEGTILGAASDSKGEFFIPNVVPGFYHVRFEMIGYQPLVKLNVRVVPNRGAFISAELVQQAVELKGITVTRAYYQKEKDAFVSSRTVDFEEIRRDPAGVIDIQRMMQALPSVVSASDQQNEIVVRGGNPGENLFLLDNIEIANPNHFGEQGTGGGPINMVNTLFVDRVDFIAGAFPAKYGDKTSSVMDIQLREGNREAHSLNMDMSMAGIGFFGEGPINSQKGAYMTSFRKSYLDLVIRQTGLSAVPTYWNAQTKVTYDLSPTDKLHFNAIYGNDAVIVEGENVKQTRGAENVDVHDNQAALGFTYQHLWRQEGLTRMTVAWTKAQFIYDVYRFNGNGMKQTYFRENDTEWDIQAKSNFVYRIRPTIELSGGVDLKLLGADFDHWFDYDSVKIYAYQLPESDTFEIISRQLWESTVFPVIENASKDSVYLDKNNIWNYGKRNKDGSWTFIRVKDTLLSRVYDEWRVQKSESFLRYGSFLQYKWRLLPLVTLNLGLRIGYFEFTGFSWLSPRFALSYFLTDHSILNFALGRHFQSESLFTLLSGNGGEKKLRSKYTDQIVIGFEHFFSEDSRGTLEIYQKNYHDIPVTVASTTIDSSDRWGGWTNKGEGYAYGIELFLQKKLARDFFGTFSYSRYWSLIRDVRYLEKKKYYPSDFDFRDVLTAIGGYKLPIKGVMRKKLEERNWLPRFLAKTIGKGAQELELSFRYRYVGGKPYTPKKYNHRVRRWYNWKGSDYNSKRLPPYHRLDLMFLWHFNFSRMNLIAFLDIQNVFDRNNIWDIQRNPDGTKEYVYQFKVFPVGGFTLEF